MKLLYCIPSLGYGGAERQFSYLAAEMARRGHDVHVAITQPEVHGAALRPAGVTLHELRARWNHDPFLGPRLVRLMRRLRPDIVQTALPQMDIAAGAAALLTRTPWVLTERTAPAAQPPTWKRALRHALGRKAAAVVSNSTAGDEYWLDVRAHSVIRNAVPFDEIAAVPAASPQNVVLFAGRMDEGKNARTLIEALAQIPSVTAVFCGDGPQRPALQRLAVDLGLSDRVAFPGLAADLWQRMKSAAVVVSLSRFEGCPNVVLEAMACGTPLVVSDIAAHREILDDATATFVPCDDAAQVAKAIVSALADRARAAAARERVREWTVAAMAQRYEELYRAIMRGAQASAVRLSNA